ncbi:hypothetical protein BpHYR1_048938 [Brachionus plicatilis]|uniref:Uncharacterized protein n=1 Tax=Brachionus plicatilis TaxID=10195 RepID=A0A3M7QV71_BRAPC|nr:hypothetical protein BpHYR1_048938 [Brachionus plicatilis]
MTETLIDSKNDIKLNINFASEPKFYRLKVNINGFRLEDVKVSLVEQNKDRVQVKISALRTLKTNNQDSTTEEYSKLLDIFRSKSNIKTDTMRYYIDPNNPLYLIVEFNSNSNQSVHVNLDDSCESLIESAAKSLLNVKNIEDLRSSIQNPFGSTLSPEIDQVFALDLIKDLNLATKTTFTPIKLVNGNNGKKVCRVEVKLPAGINSASLDKDSDDSRENNVRIKFNQLELSLEATKVKDSSISSFSKKMNLPKGTNTKSVVYFIDQKKHSLIIEADFVD